MLLLEWMFRQTPLTPTLPSSPRWRLSVAGGIPRGHVGAQDGLCGWALYVGWPGNVPCDASPCALLPIPLRTSAVPSTCHPTSSSQHPAPNHRHPTPSLQPTPQIHSSWSAAENPHPPPAVSTLHCQFTTHHPPSLIQHPASTLHSSPSTIHPTLPPTPLISCSPELKP